MKIVVTGGSGFIGTNLIENLIEQNHEILSIDIKEPKIHSHNRVWKNINILNEEELTKCLIEFNPDYIVHLAARTDLEGKSINDYESNYTGTENIVMSTSRLRNLKKIIFTSSMLVCSTGYKPKDNFDYHPTTLYGESKVMGEKIVWANIPKCDWAIIRPTSIWGPWFGVPYRNFFDLVIKKRYFHIGNKSCTKTYGYVGNAVYQIEKILFAETKNDENRIFYIGDYEPTNIEKWANEIADELGYRIIKVPLLLIKVAAIFGDTVQKIGINFPMTSFRLKNMTTDNIVDLNNTYEIAPQISFSISKGVKLTLDWMIKK